MSLQTHDTGFLETLVEFALAAGQLGYREDDSRDVFSTLQDWAEKFEADFKTRVDSGAISPDDWMEEIDSAITARFSEVRDKLEHPNRLDPRPAHPACQTPEWIVRVLSGAHPVSAAAGTP